MTSMKYVKPERIWIFDHPELDERWVQERIAEDPLSFAKTSAGGK